MDPATMTAVEKFTASQALHHHTQRQMLQQQLPQHQHQQPAGRQPYHQPQETPTFSPTGPFSVIGQPQQQHRTPYNPAAVVAPPPPPPVGGGGAVMDIAYLAARDNAHAAAAAAAALGRAAPSVVAVAKPQEEPPLAVQNSISRPSPTISESIVKRQEELMQVKTISPMSGPAKSPKITGSSSPKEGKAKRKHALPLHPKKDKDKTNASNKKQKKVRSPSSSPARDVESKKKSPPPTSVSPVARSPPPQEWSSEGYYSSSVIHEIKMWKRSRTRTADPIVLPNRNDILAGKYSSKAAQVGPWLLSLFYLNPNLTGTSHSP